MTDSLFSGLRVVDCASYVAAPAAATFMGDFGADVIKVEPLEGDSYRWSYLVPGQPEPKHNYYWMIGSRNKRGLAVNLKDPAGLRVLETLLDTTDVFITNLPLAARKRLGISYTDLAPTRPRLIYVSLTAYGETGAEVEKAGFDSTTYWGRSGLMDIMREGPDADPLRPAQGLGDNPAGVTIYAAVVSALYRREKTGLGGEVTSSLLANGLWANALDIQAKLCGQIPPERVPRRDPRTWPLMNTYRCKDGKWLNLMILREEQKIGALLKALGHEDLTDDPRFATSEARRKNSGAMIETLEAIFATRDIEAWRTRLNAHGVTFDIIATLDDVIADPQALTIGALKPMRNDPAMLTVNSPFELTGVDKVAPGRAPGLGEHSQDILRDIGLPDDEIARLLADGVVSQGPVGPGRDAG